jgi:hypothetical protein
MNYGSVEKIVSSDVEKCLINHVAASEGTRLYLKCMRNVLSAFNDEHLTIEERVHKVWYAVFFLRGWKNWISMQQSNEVTMENFTTQNAYVCIELNAHNILNLIVKLRDENNETFCNILQCQSQTCEMFFRMLRSMTSTLCTVVNFSMLDVLNRIRRIDLEFDLTSKLGETFTMPVRKHLQKAISTKLPSNSDISKIVEQAYQSAKEDLEIVGITCNCRNTQLSGEYLDSIDEFSNSDLLCDTDDTSSIAENIVDDLRVIVNNCSDTLNLPKVENITGNLLYTL